MKISDITCTCGASYEVAEAATSAHGGPGQVYCVVCEALLESWREPKLKAFRLVTAAKHPYSTVRRRPSSRSKPPRTVEV
jgi:hypothetical protein